jgi:hypothetical protein
MATLTLVRMLFCGQGMMHLVEVYDDGVEKPAADFLALVDCGGEREYSVASLKAIQTKVNSRTPPTLDCVVISHQDRDHVNQLKHLAPLMEEIGAKVTGPVFIGGEAWAGQPGKIDAFLEAVGLTRSDARFGQVGGESDYVGRADRSQLGCVVQHRDVFLRLLVSNLKGGGGNVANTSSAVVVVENGAFAVVLPGDATYETMQFVNGIQGLDALLPPVIGCAIPHHGALATAVLNYKSGDDLDSFDWSILDDFVHKSIKAKLVAASAGPWNTHCHPVEAVIDTFMENNTITFRDHTYVVYLYYQENWVVRDNYLPVECTVQKIDPDPSPWPLGRQGRDKGTSFVPGEVVYRLAPVGVLKPEEMVEFRPHQDGFVVLPPEH